MREIGLGGNVATVKGHRDGSSSLLGRWRKAEMESLNGEALAAFRRLAVQLYHDTDGEGENRSVLLANPGRSQAGFRGSLALSYALALEMHQRVLLIDLGSEAPPASGEPGERQRGWSDLIADPSLRLSDAVLPSACPNLFTLTAGERLQGLPLSMAEMQHLIDRARKAYDFVVVAGGSVLHHSITCSAVPHVGLVLLMVEQNETKVDDLDAAQAVLAHCRAHKVGLVLATEGDARKR